ncbi:MAG: ROK family protein [Acidimicrobiia bacterium]|nr:ROK family protein [Acidimicrobiia bacterium]MDH4305858.1 ROK family protein [Acidimicrobiia bacterium]MDH5292506.1 ROK family protein [Acidimicrobiia bacterium]
MRDGILGIDIGGSGIKGNLVDPGTGALLAERHKIKTPRPSSPVAVAEVVGQMVEHFSYSGPVGCTFPAVVRRGVTLSAANVDQAWIGTDAVALFERRVRSRFVVLNDADAAGIAEVSFGAAKGVDGVVLLLTFGTGIGSAMFVDERLVPNTELGHLNFAGFESVERWASSRARDDEGLSYEEWAGRVSRFLQHLNRLFSPDLFVIGGGISRKWEKYAQFLDVDVETVPAVLQNEAGIVGAAMAAVQLS